MLQKQLFAVITAGSMLLSSPVYAAEIVVTGNGAYSNNDAKVEVANTTNVVQTNNAQVQNNVTSSSSTGGNDAKYNTGGDVTIWTGDAYSKATVSNDLNSNHAVVDCCDTGDMDVLISGNGYKSENEVELKKENELGLFQTNEAAVENNVESTAKTGKNDANYNTGGEVMVKTGDATSKTNVSTSANSNHAQVGGNGETGSLTAKILGNGAYSDNDIDLELDKKLTLLQENSAWVENNVESYAKTGENDANKNTGGEVMIHTGDAYAKTEVDNHLNFNAASLDCECTLDDLMVKIAENGADSENEVEVELADEREMFQTNEAKLANNADAQAKTGYNDADYNTGDPGSDPWIKTGSADSVTTVSNTANLNQLGNQADWEWPEVDFNWNVDFSGFMAWWMAHNSN